MRGMESIKFLYHVGFCSSLLECLCFYMVQLFSFFYCFVQEGNGTLKERVVV